MEEIKIENFLKDNPNQKFPNYKTLTSKECEGIKEKITKRFNILTEISNLDLINLLFRRSSAIFDQNAEDEQFNLLKIFTDKEGKEINPGEDIFINWHQFDQIDEMKLADLSNYFEYIWYPAADDIDIFDKDLNWILSVGYDGNIRWFSWDSKMAI